MAAVIIASALMFSTAGTTVANVNPPGGATIPLATIEGEGGTAILYLEPGNPAMGVSPSFGVTWELAEPEIHLECECAVTTYFWTVTTVVFDETRTAIGCYTTDPGGALGAGEGHQTGSFMLHPCGDGDVIPAAPYRVAHLGYYDWFFLAGYSAYGLESASGPTNLLQFLSFEAILTAAAHLAVHLACAVLTADACGIVKAYTVAVEIGHAIQDWLHERICYEPHCVHVHAMHLLSDWTEIEAIPHVQTNYADCETGAYDSTATLGGYDTWNIVENLFYNRNPNSNGIGAPWPYDSGRTCWSVLATGAFLGLEGSLDDLVDRVRQCGDYSLVRYGDDGANIYTVQAPQPNQLAFTGDVNVDASTGGGRFHFRVDSEWDYEWGTDPIPRTDTGLGAICQFPPEATMPGSDCVPSCPMTVGGGGGGGLLLDPTHSGMAGLQEHVVNAFLATWTTPLDFVFENVLTINVTAEGIMGAAQNPQANYGDTNHFSLSVTSKFQPIPDIDCITDCPQGDPLFPDPLPHRGIDPGDSPLGLPNPFVAGGRDGVPLPCQTDPNADAQQNCSDPPASQPGEPSGAPQPFMLSYSAQMTQDLIDAIRRDHGGGQWVLVVHDGSSIDWAAYAQAEGYTLVPGERGLEAGIPAWPLITIVEQVGG